jgi:hypothetical protein
MLNVIYTECRIQALYAEYHYAECHYAMLNVIMLSVVGPGPVP